MDEAQRPVPRRVLLKRLGAGTAIAWTAPVISSLRTPAFAQASPRGCDTCAGQRLNCEGWQACSGPVQPCPCLQSGGNAGGWDGGCVCTQFIDCGDFVNSPECDSNADCPPGRVCALHCCGGPFAGGVFRCAVPC